jgi:hypothetical protein
MSYPGVQPDSPTDPRTTIRASLTEPGRFVDSIEPQLRQMTHHLTELSNDFEGTGSGGFYLPRVDARLVPEVL